MRWQRGFGSSRKGGGEGSEGAEKLGVTDPGWFY